MKDTPRIAFLFTNDRRGIVEQAKKGDDADTALRGANHVAGAALFSVDTSRHALLAKLLSYDSVVISDNLVLGWIVATLSRIMRAHTRVVYVAMNSSTLLRRHAHHPVRRALLTMFWKSYARVVCLSQSQLEDFAKAGIPRERLVFIPFGIDADFFASGANVQEGEYVMSVGRDAARDWPLLLEAAKQSQYPFVIITTYKSLPADTRLPPNVSVRYNLSAREVRDLYSRARLVVVPSKSDSSPEGSDCSGQTALLDAMAAGNPVVATERSWIRDYLVPDEDLVVVPAQDPTALAHVIDALWQDAALRTRLGSAGRAKVQARYTTKTFASALQKLIETL